MGKTAQLPVTTKEGQLRSSCQRKGNHHSEDQFVSLVIRPLLGCLWLVGFPVPILCTHEESIQNDYHELSRGSGFPKMDSEEDSAEPGKELPRNSAQLTGDEEVEALEDVMNITQFESSPRDRDVFTKKSKTTVTHSQNQPTVNYSSHTVKPFHYNEMDSISEENPTKTAQLFMSQKTKLRSIHLPIGIQERGGNGNLKWQDVQKRPKFCKRCRTKQILGRLMIFGSHTLLCVLNLGRYMTIFFDVTVLDGSVVFSIMLTLFFLSVIYIYVTTFYSMSKHMTPLVRLLQVYNKLYSININCESFFKNLKRVVTTSIVIQIVMGMAVVSGFHTFFPTFRKHLTPFSHLSGVSLYVVSIFYGIILCINISIVSVLFAFLRIVSRMIRKEFCTVNKHLKALFRSRKDSILELSNQGTDDLRDAHESTLRRTHKLPQAKNSDFGHDQTNKTNSDERTLSHNPARIEVSSIPGENPEAEELRPRQGEQIHCIRKEGVHHCLRQQSHSTSNSPPHHQQGNNSKSENASSNTHMNNETVHSDPGRGSTEHDTDDVVEDVVNDRFLNFAGDDDVDNPSGQTRSASGRNHQEHSFDCLHSQHQVLCAIVQHLQGCVVHLLSTSFVSGIPQFCLVIYGLGSSSLGTDEALFMAFIILEMIVAIVTCFLVGIAVRDTAHEPQDIIYEADWSKLSDTLLPKAQLFSSQLANTQIGFHVYGLFAIDRSAVLMVVGTLVTYSIVVVQFQQGSTTNCTTIHNSTVTP